MANEALLLENTRKTSTSFTVADDTQIPEGSLLVLTGDRTATKHSTGVGDAFVGIANAEKVANDGTTSIGVWDDGIFELTSSGAITRGHKVITSNVANVVEALTSEMQASSALMIEDIIVGTALTTASGNKVVVKVSRMGK